MTKAPLRIITFNFLPIGYQLLTDWIQRNKHKHVLAVTTPGPTSRPTPTYKEVVSSANRDVDVLVTTRLKSVATPLIRELKPDLITCLSFPYRITPEICAIPQYGAVNIHPAVLPAYRGPNVMRPFYDGAPNFGSTAHWIAPDYDTGRILSQRSAPMPAGEFNMNFTMLQWMQMMSETISEGFEKAIEGDAGVLQDDSRATYAAPFTEEEGWLNWNETATTIHRKASIYPQMSSFPIKAMIDNQEFTVSQVELMGENNAHAKPGSCVAKDGSILVVQSADGLLKITAEPSDSTAEG